MPDSHNANVLSLLMPNSSNQQGTFTEARPIRSSAEAGTGMGDVDISLLEESLRLSPWERMLANDDALNFAESLRAAMERRNAKP
jgi:hypothetical protein